MVTRSASAGAKPRMTARRAAAQAPRKPTAGTASKKGASKANTAVTAAPAAPSTPATRPASTPLKDAPVTKVTKLTKVTKVTKAPKAAKAEKSPKTPKEPREEKKDKLVRDSFTMPESEFRAIAAIKKRAMSVSREVKKSEVLRAGLKALQGLSDPQFKALLETLAVIKTGRPKKSAH